MLKSIQNTNTAQYKTLSGSKPISFLYEVNFNWDTGSAWDM